MELRQLEHFVTVAEERHFTHASELLQISQSGLSASIRALELELGTPLFTRSTRRVELTAAGQAFFAEAVRTLSSAAAAQNAVAAVRGLHRGNLSVGAEPCLGSIDLPHELARFRTSNSGVDIRLRFAGTLELLDSVASGRTDVALIVETGDFPAGVQRRTVTSQKLVVLCRHDHALARLGVVDLEDVSRESIVGFQSSWGAHVLARRAFAAAGLEYRIAMEVNEVHPLLDLLEHDLGVAVVPESFAAKRPDTLRAVPIRQRMPSWSVAVAVADHPSPAATAFLQQLLEYLPDQAASSEAISSVESVRSTA
ncbi:MAG: LysR family transcriptional regulator [Subtercola sp.]|jgi:DNA-binding transcriptional LysR family regulator|nr:LysR family transcriptional regulator [Subtercola sp.]